jgi:hypothetical protein
MNGLNKASLGGGSPLGNAVDHQVGQYLKRPQEDSEQSKEDDREENVDPEDSENEFTRPRILIFFTDCH